MAVLISCVALLGAIAGGYALFGGGASGTTATLAAPGCTTKAATAPAARRVPQHVVRTGGSPFDVAVTASGYAFVSLDSASAGIAVMRATGAVPTPMYTVQVSGHALGETLARTQKYLLVTWQNGAQNGLTVYRVSRLVRGSAAAASAARGTLIAPGRRAIQVAASPDGNFAFVTLQSTNQVAVFNLRKALTSGFGPSDLVGLIPVGADPIGIIASPNGRYLYVASGLHSPTGDSTGGSLTVIDLHRAETSPGSSVLETVNAGCGADRVAVSADGSTVWVSAGAANAVVAFSAAKLLSDPAHALIARVAVGQVPLGLGLVNGGSRLMVADSNRDTVRGGVPGLAVIDVRQALAGRPALTGIIEAGATPRQLALEPGGKTVLVVNSDAGQIQADKITHLP
jgi:hypothetical protein